MEIAAKSQAKQKFPYDTRVEWLASSKLGDFIKIPIGPFTHFECVVSITDSSDKKYFGLGGFNSYQHAVIATINDRYRNDFGGQLFTGIIENVRAMLNQPTYYKSPSANEKFWLIGPGKYQTNNTRNKTSASYVFGVFNVTGNETYKAYFAPSTFFWCKIWSNDVLLHDLIPVRKGEDGYVYDKMTGLMYGNEAEWPLQIGPDA